MRYQRRALKIAAICIGLAGHASCGTREIPIPTVESGTTIPLAVGTPFTSLDLPANSRPHAPTAPERIPLSGWTRGEGGYTVANPIRVRNLYFLKPNPGMRMARADGTEIPHKYFSDDATVVWKYTDKKLIVEGLTEAPKDGEIGFYYPKATERERGLNFSTAGKSPEDFVRSTAQVGDQSRTGLLLPAPASATWTLEVPERAALRFHVSLVEPELTDGPRSDGATVRFQIDDGSGTTTLWEDTARRPKFEPVRVDLSAYAGKEVTLTLTTEPGDDSTFDYVFIADPIVGTVKARPRRVFLIFVDTLRPDHLSTYGYTRETTPALTTVADAGVRFTNARSIAPWTLPSARTMLTGQNPEQFFDSETLQGRLATEGWATAMFAGNMYLGPSFGLNRDWGLHRVELLPHAEDQVDQALSWLDEQEGRNTLLLLHLMDPHLPYKEPQAYRRMFAGDAPDALRRRENEYHRGMIVGARLKSREDRQYVRDRYDNNIRYADDQLARLFERMHPEDIVMFVSDHGEEFWDHGGFEHGHALYDELLRVPMILRAPGLKPGLSVDAPVSLLDVTPTLLDLLDLPAPDLAGTSLVAASKGDEEAQQALIARDQAFGRPLYGHERWGSLSGGLKYQVHLAQEELYDLSKDGEERHEMLNADPALRTKMRDAMARALDKDVAVAYRIGSRFGRKQPRDDLTAVITVPGGVRAVWVGQDPTAYSLATVAWTPGSDTFTATWPKPFRGSRDVWFVPVDDVADVTHKLSLEMTSGSIKRRHTVGAGKPADFPDEPQLLLRDRTGERGWDLGFGITPIPDLGDADLNGYDAETAEALKAMGYLVGDDEPEPDKPEAPGSDAP